MGNDNLEIFSNDPRLKGFGYIPGGYMWGKCRGCKNQLIGVAKYSTRCFECASKLLRKKLEMIEADILLSCNESAKTALGYDPSKAWDPDPIINHEEAFEFAHIQKKDSNLARCYLDLKNKVEDILSFKNPLEDLNRWDQAWKNLQSVFEKRK